jgi:hypothetical protein
MRRSNNDGAGVGEGTATAGLGAIAPITPLGDLAADGTRVGVAIQIHGEGRAFHTAKGLRYSDTAELGVCAAAAEVGACSWLYPITDHAIDGAAVGVAVKGFNHGWA